MLNKLTFSDFSVHINEPYQIGLVSDTGESRLGPLKAELVEVSKIGTAPQIDGQRQPFSIIFRGPSEPLLPQQIYRVEHEEQGAMDLFLVPLGPDEHGMQYEAVFT